MTLTSGFEILVIEDNPGDARLIEELLLDTEELVQRVAPHVTDGGVPQVQHEPRLSSGISYLEANPVDIILLDLHLPDSAGLETLSRLVDVVDDTPIVVLTGLDDRETGIRAIRTGAQDYLVKDEVTSSLLVRSLHHAVGRKEQEIARARHQDQLETLNRLGSISGEITHLVIQAESRSELEQSVCERLTDADAFRVAWIGDVQRGTNQMTPRAAAGDERESVENLEISITEHERERGPTGAAFFEQELQVGGMQSDGPNGEPWHEFGGESDSYALAAIPIVHEGFSYGVLHVYANSDHVFSEPEREMLARVGSIVGHGISSLERKTALVSESLLELEFSAEGVADPIRELTAGQSGRVEIDRLVQAGSESWLFYGSVGDIDVDEFRDRVSAVPWIAHLHVITVGDENFTFEILVSREFPLVTTITAYSGRIQSVRIADGDLRVIAEVPHGSDTRQLIERIQEDCPGATFVARRSTEREQPTYTDGPTLITNHLTDRQRTVLEIAVFSGYFDWPRTTTGEEIAERLSIAPPTFSQHLRTAERKVFETLFGK